MEIIIAGAGKVGFYLARTLCMVHNVTIIDKNAEALNRLHENLDIYPVLGNIEDPETYKKLSGHEVDLFIAVAERDETNLIATLIADEAIDVARKYIRLKNSYFFKMSIRDKLGVTDAVFPYRLTSQTIGMLLKYPKANNVKQFVHTDFKLISVLVTTQMEPMALHRRDIMVVGIERDKRFFIPSEDETIRTGDMVYFFGSEAAIRQQCEQLEQRAASQIERCVVFGAGELGVTVTQTLTAHGKNVKLIEKDMELCEKADERLGGTVMTINCSYGMTELFENEHLADADMAVAATDDDEYNIIKCLEARQHGIKKVIAVNNEPEYYSLMHSLGIVVVRGPKISAYNGLIEMIDSNRIVLFRKFCGGEGAIFMRRIYADSDVIDNKPPPLSQHTDEKFLLVRGETLMMLESVALLKEDDVIVVFCSRQRQEQVKMWINGL